MLQSIGKYTFTLILLVSFIFAAEPVPKGDPIALSAPDEFLISPQWSPSGNHVAASGASHTGLYLIDFPTGNTSQLSHEYSAGYGFSWSHDGSQIAAKISNFEGMFRNHTLIRIDIEDASVETMSPSHLNMAGTPRWSQSDSHIYLTHTDKFESFASNTGSSENITESIFYLNNGQVLKRKASELTGHSILTNSDPITSYAISPDESQIVYSTTGQNLWVANIDGSETRKLGSGIVPSWSPDSKWIVFMLTEDNGHSILNSEIFIMNTSQSNPINISNTTDQLEMHPQWSPDGSWIVYDTDERGQLFVQQMDWR